MEEDKAFLSAVFTLQSETSDIGEKLNGLRELQHYVSTNDKIDPYNRKRINQVILENVLKIILDENIVINSFRKQLVRAELYVMLSQLLQSNQLFGTELTKPTLSKIHEVGRLMKSNSLGDIMSPNKTETSSQLSLVESNSTTSLLPLNDDPVSKLIQLKQNSKLQQPQPPRTANKSNFHQLASMTSPATLYTSATLQSNIIQQTMQEKKQTKRIEMYTKLKPRSTVLFHDQLSNEQFVPGSDPLNFIEQDRKLGYQKPRVWFPTPQLDIAKDLQQTNMSDVNPIVEEYMKMKALASYVGDLLLPPSTNKNTSSKVGSHLGDFHSSQAISSILPKKKASNILLYLNKINIKHTVDPQQYANALNHAMTLWTPILKVHVPIYGKKHIFSYIKEGNDDNDNDNDDPYREIIRDPFNNTAQQRRGGGGGGMFYEESISNNYNNNKQSRTSMRPYNNVYDDNNDNNQYEDDITASTSATSTSMTLASEYTLENYSDLVR